MTENKMRPILFSAPMVNALLSGQKTQTRRVADMPALKPFVKYLLQDFEGLDHPNPKSLIHWFEHRDKEGYVAESFYIKSPYGAEGDSLWVREAFSVLDVREGYQNPNVCDDFLEPQARVRYAADGSESTRDLIVDADMGFDDLAQAQRGAKKKTVPGIHMGLWACRLTLKITSVRLERLQDISEEDAFAEGVEFSMTGDPYDGGVTYHFKDYLCKGIEADDDGEKIVYNNSFADDPVASFRTLWDAINGKTSPWADNPFVWVIEFEAVGPKGSPIVHNVLDKPVNTNERGLSA